MNQETEHETKGDDTEEEGPPPREVPVYAVPAGYEKVGSNVLGYYDPDHGAVSFVMSGMRLLDNSADDTKSSALILAELTAPATLTVNTPEKSEQVPKLFPAGTGFGIWAKAGMRDLINLQGAKVWMAPAGFQKMKDTGRKRNPMALFSIARDPSGPKGETLTLLEDARRESLTEAAKSDNPPWHLLVIGKDFGRPAAKELLIQQLNAKN